jgi:hypothetical protein
MSVWDLIYKSITTPRMIITDPVDAQIATGKPPIKVNLPRSPFAAKPRKVTKASFEAMVIPRAQLMAAGAPVNAMHYTLARKQLLQELAANNTVLENGAYDIGAYDIGSIARRVRRRRVRRSDERGADHEAGGNGKI